MRPDFGYISAKFGHIRLLRNAKKCYSFTFGEALISENVPLKNLALLFFNTFNHRKNYLEVSFLIVNFKIIPFQNLH